MVQHDQLHECAGFLRRFPLCCAFAGTQANDGTAEANTFAGFERDVADQAVAFVEQAENGDPFLHRGDPDIGILRPGRHDTRFGNRATVSWRRRRGFALSVASRQGKRSRSGRAKADREALHHAESGVQGW